MLVAILNGLIFIVSLIFDGVMFLLPDTPFQFESLKWGEFGQLVGVFFPLNTMLQHLISILAVILTYYGIRSILRMIKQVQ